MARVFGKISQNALTLLLIFVVLLGVMIGYVRFQDWNTRNFAQRLHVAEPNEYFLEHVRPDMTARQVMQAVPRSDRIQYFSQVNGRLVQRFVYKIAFAADYHVNVIYSGNRVVDVDVSDAYLGQLEPIPIAAARQRLGIVD